MAPEQQEDRQRVGLCADCRFAKRIESGKGSRFFLCRRSETDPTYARYPRLPVIRCAGYEKSARDGRYP